jgi:hypothetical protein
MRRARAASRHAAEEHGVGEGGEDLQAIEPERAVPPFATSTGELDRRQRHPDADDVGDHVPGVREQGERVRHQAGDDLDHHEHGEQDERREQRANVALAGADRRVVVAVLMLRRHEPQSAPQRVESHAPVAGQRG